MPIPRRGLVTSTRAIRRARGSAASWRGAALANDVLEFDPVAHVYRVRGKRLPSVTQATDRLCDYSRVPPDALEAARRRGTAVHAATALYDEGRLDWGAVDDGYYGYIEAWLAFRADTGFTPFVIEHRVFSMTLGAAGTIDRTGTFERLPSVKSTDEILLDVKTTAERMPGVGPQTAGYKLLYNEGAKKKLKRRFVVLLRPDGTYRLEELKDPHDETVFRACLIIAKWEMLHA